MFLEFDFSEGTSYKLYPNFDFFKVSKGDKGQFWCRQSSSGVPHIEMTHKTKY